jgi:hypothetical protein
MEAPEGRKPEGVGVNPHIRGSSPERPKKVGGRCSADSRHATSEPPHFNKGSYAVRPRTAGWIRAEPRAANPWIMASREQHARVSSQPSHFYPNTRPACRDRVHYHAHVVQQQRHDVEIVASAGAAPKRDSASSCVAEQTWHSGRSRNSCHEHQSSGLKLRQRSNRLLTGLAGCMSLQAHSL